jgi:hypothetical protein
VNSSILISILKLTSVENKIYTEFSLDVSYVDLLNNDFSAVYKAMQNIILAKLCKLNWSRNQLNQKFFY